MGLAEMVAAALAEVDQAENPGQLELLLPHLVHLLLHGQYLLLQSADAALCTGPHFKHVIDALLKLGAQCPVPGPVLPGGLYRNT